MYRQRGQHFTVVCCMTATGTFVTLPSLFREKKIENEFYESCTTWSDCIISRKKLSEQRGVSEVAETFRVVDKAH